MKKKHTKEQKIKPQKPSYMKKGLHEMDFHFSLGWSLSNKKGANMPF
jgi:hypothetical protein